MKILITGGAGFIGRHVVKLLAPEHEIVVLDSFEKIVHGPSPDPHVEGAAQVVDDRIEDFTAVLAAVHGCDAVIHLAAGVSVDASFSEPSRFVRTNALGTAVLWEAISKAQTVKHVIVASSMSVYGAGYAHRGVFEDDPCAPASIYGLSKHQCEQLSLLAGKLYGIGVTSLRIWNTYGPGQSLFNAETGVLAIFAARLLAGERPRIYENGEQIRDFIEVSDVANAFKCALESPARGIYNIGTGDAATVFYAANLLCSHLTHGEINPEVTHYQRLGDVRYCYPNISRAQSALGWKPTIKLADGLAQYADWLRNSPEAALPRAAPAD
jgi:dTDP-L-rhamnose 4-epimerase